VRASRLRAGELLAGAGAVALGVLSVLDWWPGRSGWSALGWAGDALVAVALALALWLVVATATGARVSRAVAAGVLATLTATAALVVVAVRVLDGGARWPAWLGLAGALALAAGGWRSIADERTDAPESAAVAPPARPAPPA
jgi:hypothetical protein